MGRTTTALLPSTTRHTEQWKCGEEDFDSSAHLSDPVHRTSKTAKLRVGWATGKSPVREGAVRKALVWALLPETGVWT